MLLCDLIIITRSPRQQFRTQDAICPSLVLHISWSLTSDSFTIAIRRSHLPVISQPDHIASALHHKQLGNRNKSIKKSTSIVFVSVRGLSSCKKTLIATTSEKSGPWITPEKRRFGAPLLANRVFKCCSFELKGVSITKVSQLIEDLSKWTRFEIFV